MDNDDLGTLTSGQLESEKMRCERRKIELAAKLPKGFAAAERDRDVLGEMKRLALRIAKIDQLLDRRI